MIIFSDPLFEELFNKLFTSEEERRLKIIKFNNMMFNAFSIYTPDSETIERLKTLIQEWDENLHKAKLAVSLYTIMAKQGVTVKEVDPTN